MSKLDKLLEAATEISGSQGQLESIEHQIEAARLRLDQTVQESNRKGAQILKEANDKAEWSLKVARQREKLVSQREKDTAVREEAVKWVDEEVERLKKLEKTLKQDLALADKTRADARAERQLWVTRQAELKDGFEELNKQQAASPVAKKALAKKS